MNPPRSKTQARRRPLFRIEAESLETRQLLTGGAGNTFALVRGTVAGAKAEAPTSFSLPKSHFSAARGRRLTLGVDVVAPTGSKLKPVITGVDSRVGKRTTSVYRGPKGPKALAAAASGKATNAVLADVTMPARSRPGGSSYVVKVRGAERTSGDFLLGFYLPGDANGDGKVGREDVAAIKALVGKTVADSGYAFDADADRDGRIGRSDVMLARKNLGASTTISPDLTANLAAASDTGAPDRITNNQTVAFNGEAAPGAKISFEEVNKKSPGTTTTADASGKYGVSLKLAEGTNTYRVTAVDAFGQTISGSIQPVTYTTGPVPQAGAIRTTRA